MEAAILTLFGFALGASVSSFLNVVADRLPAGGSLSHPPSRCPDDGHRLMPYELVPVFSYAVQSGRCRVCGSRIPFRVFFVELIGGVAFAAVAYAFGLTVDALLLAVAFSFLLVIAVIDLEHKLIPNKVLALAIPTAVLSSMFWSPELRTPTWEIGPRELDLLVDAVAAGLVGCAFWLLVYIVTELIPYTRGVGLGFGDVKFALAIGPWVGLGGLLMTYYVAIVIGGIFGIMLIIYRIASRKPALRQVIPYGPFLCAGTAIGMVWGQELGSWYLGVLGY